MAANQPPDDYLDDMTRSTTSLGMHGHGFKYTELADGAIAYVSEMRCKGHDPDIVKDYSVWGPNVALGFAITSAVKTCDDFKGGVVVDPRVVITSQGSEHYDWSRVCPQYAKSS